MDEEVVVSKMEITTEHGAIKGKTQTKAVNFYNLDAIISVGYRVNWRPSAVFMSIHGYSVLKYDDHIKQFPEIRE